MTGTKRAVAAVVGGAVVAAALIVLVVQVTGASEKTITVDGKMTAFHGVQQKPGTDSPGDLGVLAGRLTRNGKAAGSYQGYCVNITGPGNSECTFTFALDDGQLVITTGYGKFNGGSGRSHDPIIGGSGDYAGARGWAEGLETGEDTLRYVFHISK